ncbi:MAG TPA: alpha/beta hydrolase [Mycobacteriales bacterium]|nr:alpha/beta hydrolase [Mycobacteriales bacterium]
MRRRASTVTEIVEAYGDHPLQVGEWYVPTGEGAAATVVLIHGGFWGPRYDRELEHHVAKALAERGYLCWNIDYRSGAEPWPATLSDVAAAYDHLQLTALAGRVDRLRVAVVGHSAGGHLAAWLASRHRLPDGAPGYNPDLLRPALAVPQAGVVALARAAASKVGRGAPAGLIGGSTERYPERWAAADPIALLPTGVRSVLIHTERDRTVPLWQSRAYVEQATAAGDDSTLEVCRGDHFAHLDPKREACQRMFAALATMGSGSDDSQ